MTTISSQQHTTPVIIEPAETIQEKMARMYVSTEDLDNESVKTDSPTTDLSSDSISLSSSNRSSQASSRPPQPPPHQPPQPPPHQQLRRVSASNQGAPATGSPYNFPESPQFSPTHQNNQHQRNASVDSSRHTANQSSISSLSAVLPAPIAHTYQQYQQSQEYINISPNRSPGLPPRQPSPQNGLSSSPRPSFISPMEQNFIPTGGFIPSDPNANEQSGENLPPPLPEQQLLNHSHLKPGGNASLLSYSQTISLYRENAKKTNNPDMQFDFAVFMVEAAKPITDNETARWEFLGEAEKLLRALANRGHSESQYYLANLYASSLLNRKGKTEFDKAFPLFVQASKHNHPDAAYRAAKCYEDGLGCKKDASKAIQFYRKAATLNHPGAMYRLGIAELASELSLTKNPRDGVKWLKRSGEAATVEYPHALHELGLLHERGVDNVVFVDPEYSVSLYTQAAELGYAPSAFRLGECYEYGKLGCPQDAALSIHYYTLAAQQGHREACFALTAWYLVGSPPVLPQSDTEAYLWARRAAEKELPKAEYAIGYFTEVGIGVPKDLVTAIDWYKKAAKHGEKRAIQRLQKQMSNVDEPTRPTVRKDDENCKMM